MAQDELDFTTFLPCVCLWEICENPRRVHGEVLTAITGRNGHLAHTGQLANRIPRFEECRQLWILQLSTGFFGCPLRLRENLLLLVLFLLRELSDLPSQLVVDVRTNFLSSLFASTQQLLEGSFALRQPKLYLLELLDIVAIKNLLDFGSPFELAP